MGIIILIIAVAVVAFLVKAYNEGKKMQEMEDQKYTKEKQIIRLVFNEIFKPYAEEAEKNLLDSRHILASKTIILKHNYTSCGYLSGDKHEIYFKRLIVDDKQKNILITEFKSTGYTHEQILNKIVNCGDYSTPNIVDKVVKYLKDNKGKDDFKSKFEILAQFEFKDILKYELIKPSGSREERTARKASLDFEIVVYLDSLDNSIVRIESEDRKIIDEVASTLEYLIKQKSNA